MSSNYNYPEKGIAATEPEADVCFMNKPYTSTSSATCIFLQSNQACCAKKKECCKKYKHGKRCKKCPKSSK